MIPPLPLFCNAQITMSDGIMTNYLNSSTTNVYDVWLMMSTSRTNLVCPYVKVMSVNCLGSVTGGGHAHVSTLSCRGYRIVIVLY